MSVLIFLAILIPYMLVILAINLNYVGKVDNCPPHSWDRPKGILFCKKCKHVPKPEIREESHEEY